MQLSNCASFTLPNSLAPAICSQQQKYGTDNLPKLTTSNVLLPFFLALMLFCFFLTSLFESLAAHAGDFFAPFRAQLLGSSDAAHTCHLFHVHGGEYSLLACKSEG